MALAADLNTVKLRAIEDFVRMCEAHLRCRPALGMLRVMRIELQDVRVALTDDKNDDSVSGT